MTAANKELKGTLIIAGSGIASIRHITLETLAHIERADKVFYVVTDPATEAFLQDKSKGDYSDLAVYYDKDKNRAIAIARAEGYRARMLPGVSAEDCLYSDLDFDPAMSGCTTQEATSIILYNKRLDPSVHNIIWQVGAVGISNMALELLVDRLEEDFGPNQKVVHYIGAVLPQSTTVKEELTITELRNEDVVKQITSISTFYLPPRPLPPVSKEVLEKLGFADTPLSSMMPPFPGITNNQSPGVSPYRPNERNALENLEKHVPPVDYKKLEASPAIRRFMTDLALRPDLLERYKADPSEAVDVIPGLSPAERFALRLNKPGPLEAVMRSNAGSERLTLEEIAAYQELNSKALLTWSGVGVTFTEIAACEEPIPNAYLVWAGAGVEDTQ
ncbi:hypothetical protein V5O48_001136 [Marasmius crinis-equi]|uniref:Uncharacterized protein n=1 Tax=Marasmius crinis-equi TaxID=585013 RepID=A0ABR3FZ74_9AGAR